MAPRQAALVNTQLNALQTALTGKGIPLLFHEVANFATNVETAKNACIRHGVSRIFYDYQYEVSERQRDVAVEKLLPQVVCEGSDDSMVLSPGAVMAGNHEAYKVFMPLKNAWLKRTKDGIPECVSAPKMRESGALDSPLISVLLSYPQQDFDTQQFPAEEKLTIVQLRHFYQQAAGEYEQLRDFPTVDGTS